MVSLNQNKYISKGNHIRSRSGHEMYFKTEIKRPETVAKSASRYNNHIQKMSNAEKSETIQVESKNEKLLKNQSRIKSAEHHNPQA